MRSLALMLLVSVAACGANAPPGATQPQPGAPVAPGFGLRPAVTPGETKDASVDGFDALRGVLADDNVTAMLDGDWQLAAGSVLVTAAVTVMKNSEEMPHPKIKKGDFIVGLGAGLEGDRPLFLVFAGVDSATGKPRVIEILRRKNTTSPQPQHPRTLMRAGEAIKRALAQDDGLGNKLLDLKESGATSTREAGRRWGLRYTANLEKEQPTAKVTLLMAKPHEPSAGGGGGPTKDKPEQPSADISELGAVFLDLTSREIVPGDPGAQAQPQAQPQPEPQAPARD